jgi:hypothetical protein
MANDETRPNSTLASITRHRLLRDLHKLNAIQHISRLLPSAERSCVRALSMSIVFLFRASMPMRPMTSQSQENAEAARVEAKAESSVRV